ncbi:MAG: hypothetical protein ACRDPB_10105, partial [Nocardioidaceae bacterium]
AAPSQAPPPQRAQPTPPPGRQGQSPCDTVDLLPVAKPQPLDQRPHGRVLVGGRGLRALDLASGEVTELTGMRPHEAVLTVQPGPDTPYVLAQEVELCSYRSNRAYRLSEGHLDPLPTGSAADELLTGPQGVWSLNFGSHAVTLHPAQPGPTFHLDGFPVADTEEGIVVSRGGTQSRAPRLALVGTDGHRVRSLGRGDVYGVSDKGIMLVADIDGRGMPHRHCGLTLRDAATGQTDARYFTPPGRSIASRVVFGPHAHLAAMLLSRGHADPRWHAAHPGPPADVAVLNLGNGKWRIAPGLELPPKSQAALAFDPTGSWIMAAVDYGDHTRIFGWRPGLPSVGVLADLPGDDPVSPALLTVPSG